MKSYKYKYSFLIIEILLGLFLIVIFVSTARITPRYLLSPLIQKGIFIECHHHADRKYLNLLLQLQELSLPTTKGKKVSFPTEEVGVKIFSSTQKQIQVSTDVELIEIKHNEEIKFYLYDYTVEFSYKLNNKSIEKKILYSFIVKS